MIRFIDLRGQGTEHRFAFWDTTGDRFVDGDGEQAWSTWKACAIAFEYAPAFRDRLRGLCPDWALEPDDGTHEEIDPLSFELIVGRWEIEALENY